jgi:hypothetical protein
LVDQDQRAGRKGFSDALAGDTLIDNAARAALLGAEPLEYLSQTDHDLRIVGAIYRRASELAFERRLDTVKAIVEAIYRSAGGRL